MKKLALIVAMMFGVSGVVLAADAPTGATAGPTKTEAKVKHTKPAKKAQKKAAKKAEAAKTEADKK